jgi:hypothetical protein
MHMMNVFSECGATIYWHALAAFVPAATSCGKLYFLMAGLGVATGRTIFASNSAKPYFSLSKPSALRVYKNTLLTSTGSCPHLEAGIFGSYPLTTFT